MIDPVISPKEIRILVVEDESLIAEEIRERLARLHYHVLAIADTAAKAIENAATYEPDLILMDIRLKGDMQGVEAADHIYKRYGVPSIFVTAHSDPDTIQRAKSSGQFGYVLKPFEEGALQAAIEIALQRHHLDRDLKIVQITQAAMIQSASDAIIAKSLNGVILSWNPAAENLFGYTAGEVIGRNVSLLIPQGRESEEAGILERIRRGERVELDATERRHKNGSLVDVWINAAPVRDARGNVTGAVNIARDISERKRAERKLQESQAQLVASQRIAHVGSWELDVSGFADLESASLRCSEEWFRVFGYEPNPNGVANSLFWQRVHPEDRPKVAAALRQALETVSVFEIEHRLELPDGATRIIHERGEFIRHAATGQPVKLIGTAQDITARRQAEQALQEREKRFRAIVEGMPMMLVAFDEDGVPIAWNHECERITGYLASEIVGNPRALEILYPDSTARARMLEDFHIHGGSTRGQLWSVSCKDGTARTIEWSSISDQLPIPGWAVWSVGVDMTRRLRLEEELRQSQKMEGLGRMAGGIAHDFNNLLTVIIGYSDAILYKLPEGDSIREMVAFIRNAGQNAADLTSQLLAFGRCQTIRPTLLDLNQLLQDDEPILKSAAGEKIALITQLNARGRVMADAVQIHRVIMNLVVNARDAMPGGGSIEIRTTDIEVNDSTAALHPQVAPGNFVMTAVADTGPGVAPDIMERIFDPFFTTKTGTAGSGLGLAIVYTAVKQAGGSIRVISKPGTGATFSIYLPRVKGPAVITRSQSVASAAPVRKGGETILLVEDRADVRGFVRCTLDEQGYRVLEAESGERALQQAELHSGPIHLMLTDVVMPVMTGVELAARMKTLRPDTKTLFMSGYSADPVGHRGLLDPDAARISKPFSPDALAAKVREVLGPAIKSEML